MSGAATPTQRVLAERVKRARNYCRFILCDRLEDLEVAYLQGNMYRAQRARARLRTELESEWPGLAKLAAPELDLDELDPA
jgi:hypothetical protein